MNDKQDSVERARAFGRTMGQSHAVGKAVAGDDELAFPDAEAQLTLHEWAGDDPAAFGELLQAAQEGYRDGLASTPDEP